MAPLPTYPPALGHERPLGGIAVDDHGNDRDIVARVLHEFSQIFPETTEDELLRDLMPSTAKQKRTLRQWIATEFFDDHLKRYSSNRRRAPIYWQLATPSTSYSAWLYLHSLTKDTLFRLHTDFVAPKLALEERKLDSMVREASKPPTAQELKTLAIQESFTEELRAFLVEVTLAATVWNPNVEDGVMINFAPLWRLVPQHKPWQKELKSTWDSLCEGEYDWARLAMHLWPERVLPKCSTDRSLAIAHGLQEVFWMLGEDGKWKPRPTPTRPVGELVRERSSAAVKAALKNLVETPTANPNGGRRRGGRSLANVANGGVN